MISELEAHSSQLLSSIAFGAAKRGSRSIMSAMRAAVFLYRNEPGLLVVVLCSHERKQA
jgi:hypothetical protein